VDTHETFEPERYELREGPAYEFALSRREFAGIAGAGLLLAITVRPAGGQRGGSASAPLESRLHIAEDGTITIFTGKVEVGQGSRVEIAMAAAEELRVAAERVKVVMADTAVVPNDGITAGSRTTPATVPAVRRAAAAARELLLDTAARQWDLSRKELQVVDGAITRPGSRESIDYAHLARSAELLAAYKQPPGEASLTPVDNWRVLGGSAHRFDGREIVTGTHQYPSDIRRPGMLYGAVLRPPSYGATLEGVDTSEAEKMPGVTIVREGNFAGCVAPTSYAARKAVEALGAKARWKTPEHPSSTGLFTLLKERARNDGQQSPRIQSSGSVEDGLAQAAKRLSAVYQVPYIQHAPMEPRAAVAEWQDGRLTVWTGTQNPHGVRAQLAQAFHLPEERIRVIVPDTGGGFGGKHTGEAAIEAARLAREAGRPVSLRWTRAEEFMWAYFRPAGLFEIEAGLDANGKLTAWDFTNYNAGTAAIATPYQVPNTRTRFFYCDSPLREGSYRGIAATANNFARECFMDELAGAQGTDPLEFRLRNAENTRLRDVLAAAANRFGWEQRRKQKGRGVGVGIAGGTEKGSYVAACAEVETAGSGKPPRIRRFCMAFECGAILNPANLLAQVEGCVIQGLGGALMEAIEYEKGRLKNGSFARYPVPRFRDVPPMDIVLVDRKDLPPAGAGETPIIAVAPAIANAVFDASGERVRSLPVRWPGGREESGKRRA
jgi:isoquinoline 1-oxidoreductase